MQGGRTVGTLFCLLHRPGHPPSSLPQNAHDGEESAADFFFRPLLFSLFSLCLPPFPFQMVALHVSSTSSSSEGMTCVCMGMCVCVCVCVYVCVRVCVCACFLSFSPSSPPWLWHSTRPPPPLLPPIIEADSASQACTRHTRWLQQLERSLGHYGSLHYGKRRRGGEERRSSSDKKLIWQVIYALPSLFGRSLPLTGLDVSCPVSSLSLFFGCDQLWTAWFAWESRSRKGGVECTVLQQQQHWDRT